jgi:hypothetical protein
LSCRREFGGDGVTDGWARLKGTRANCWWRVRDQKVEIKFTGDGSSENYKELKIMDIPDGRTSRCIPICGFKSGSIEYSIYEEFERHNNWKTSDANDKRLKVCRYSGCECPKEVKKAGQQRRRRSGDDDD